MPVPGPEARCASAAVGVSDRIGRELGLPGVLAWGIPRGPEHGAEHQKT